MNHPFSYPQQSETVQEISIIAQFIHDNPVMSIFIIVLLFILAVMILSSIGAPTIKKFAKRWLGDYGVDESGNEIRHEDIQLEQLELDEKESQTTTRTL